MQHPGNADPPKTAVAAALFSVAALVVITFWPSPLFIIVIAGAIAALGAVLFWHYPWFARGVLGLAGIAVLLLLCLPQPGDPSISCLIVSLTTLLCASWVVSRRIMRGREGTSDGSGNLDFASGGHGRTLAPGPVAGEVVAWRARRHQPGGYRDDGDGTRYRILHGTQQTLILRTRRWAAVACLTVAAAFSVIPLRTLSTLTHQYNHYRYDSCTNRPMGDPHRVVLTLEDDSPDEPGL